MISSKGPTVNLRIDRRRTRQNRSGERSELLICLALLLGGIWLGRTAHAAGVSGEAEGKLRGEVRKEITDPCLGQRWQLVVDASHPGWPARMTLLNPNGQRPGNHVRAGSSRSGRTSLDQADLVSGVESMIIRVGDRVTVDQDSDILRARFEAVALDSAGRGERLRVRLIVAANRLQGQNSELTAPGPVIAVVATGIGLARWSGTGQTALAATDQTKDRTGRIDQ
jgi:hypothetical protein